MTPHGPAEDPVASLHQDAPGAKASLQQGVPESQSATQHPRLISSRSASRTDATATLHFLDHPERVIRYTEVALNEVVTRQGALQEGSILLLNLFEDVEAHVEVSRAKVNVNGTFSVAAMAPDGGVYVAMATTGGRSLATILIPGRERFYKIISDPDTHQHYLYEKHTLDLDHLEGGPSLIPGPDSADPEEERRIREHIRDKGLGPDDMARIGVMVVYTPAARQWAQQSGGGINNVVAISMVSAQMTLDNSDTGVVMQLVHSAEVDYVESGSSSDDLSVLTSNTGGVGTGHMDEVHDWRDDYGADLTALFALVSDVGGLAWLLNNRFGNPNVGFSLTRVQQAATGYTHIHEMGHNMGLHHHADQNFQPGPTNWTNWPENRWSAGWRWSEAEGGRFCSIMTYTSGQYFPDGINHTQVPYMSNPDVLHFGVPTGDATRGDNARTIREIKHVIAAYRPIDEFLVVTNIMEDIGAFDATTGGTVIDDGGQAVLKRGIVWTTSGEPSLDNYDGIVEKGPGEAAYTVHLTGLNPQTTYRVRAYATSEQQTEYGNVRQFNTLAALSPVVETRELAMVGHNRAQAGGDVTFDGNTDVTVRGVVWSTSPGPDINNYHGISFDGEGEGVFTSEMTELTPETQYYYRAYATNFTDTSYGPEQSFTTLLVRVFPNPATDRLHLGFNNQSEGRVVVRLFSPQGQVVKEREVPETGDFETVFRLDHLRGGLYYLKIFSEEDFPVWPVMISPQR